MEARRQTLQERVLNASPKHHATVEDCFTCIRKLLVTACDQDILTNKKFEVFKAVRCSSPPSDVKILDAISINGGEKDLRRERNKLHFERNDGAWFDSL